MCLSASLQTRAEKNTTPGVRVFLARSSLAVNEMALLTDVEKSRTEGGRRGSLATSALFYNQLLLSFSLSLSLYLCLLARPIQLHTLYFACIPECMASLELSRCCSSSNFSLSLSLSLFLSLFLSLSFSLSLSRRIIFFVVRKFALFFFFSLFFVPVCELYKRSRSTKVVCFFPVRGLFLK